jgi:hypothetical protein
MKWLRALEGYALYPIIIAALGAGLAAAYGRELEQGRTPDRPWWLRRLLIMPVLAITAAAITQGFGLSHTLGAFTAAMLSLGGYDLLRLIEDRWRARLLAASDTGAPS